MAYRLTDASSINDLVRKSHKLTEGPPAWHRLHTTKSIFDKDGKIRKWTFGEKHGNIQNSTIMVVGETGTGKTTLINTMVNYFLGVKFEDEVWFEITEEEKKEKRNRTESQTSEVTVYEIISKERLSSLTIIDTPGYGDTRGIEKDMDIARNLHELFLHGTGVKDLDAVCLVLKASQNRVSDSQRYIFEGVLSLFGKDIEDIIVLCITHSDGGPPTDALEAVKNEKVPCCYDNEDEPVHFLFNNRQSEKRTQRYEQVSRSAWVMGEHSMGEFLDFIKSRQRKSVTLLVSVLEEHMQLEACVMSLKERIKFREAKHSELTGVQKTLEQNKEKIEEDEKFPFTVTTVYKEKVDITDASWWDQMVTSCGECHSNCHEHNCWVARNAEWCEVMKGQLCTVCGCPDSKHVRKYKKYVTKLREETVIFKQLKFKYSDTNEEKVSYDKSAVRKVETENEETLKMKEEMMKVERGLKILLNENKEEKKNLLNEAYMSILKLCDTPLKPHSAFTIQYLDFLIPRVEEVGTTEWAQKLRDLQRVAAKDSTNFTVGLSGASSSSLNDYIRESHFLDSGPPAQCRLPTTRTTLNKEGKIRKWTFGQKYGKLQNQTILMVGETGTGKTTLINTMVNYFLGVKFEDKVWFEITEEEQRDPSKSQTSEVTVYEIISEERLSSLTIVDTPGYGHTEGIEKDKEIARNLRDLFLHDAGVKELDAVCLVLKASQNRISDRQRYIFEGVLSLFGKDIEDNIVLFTTHSDGGPSTNALKAVKEEKVPCCHDDEDEPVHFLFNNRQSEKRTQQYEQVSRSAWEMGESSIGKFFEFLKSRQRKSLTLTVSVLNERTQLEACVVSLRERIKFREEKQTELTGVQKTLEQNKEKIEKDKNFPFTVTTAYKEKVEITGASWWDQMVTSCDECQENCHEYGCWVARNAKWCAVMKRKHCTVCGCPDSKHVKEDRKYKTKQRQETVTFEQLKLKYGYTNQEKNSFDKSAFKKVKTEHEETLRMKEEMMKLESRLKTLLAENEEKKKGSVKEACMSILKLSEIALKPDSAFTIQHLDFLVPRVEEAGTAEWVQKLKDLQRAADKESTNSAMRYLRKAKIFFLESK